MKISQGMTVCFASFGGKPEHVFVARVMAVYEPEGRCLVDDGHQRGPRVVTTARLRPAPSSARSTPLGGRTA